MVTLDAWATFYVIIGSAAAALTGLMFVVVTLLVRSPQRREGDSLGAFGTPTVVHFCAALGLAASSCAPWQALWQASLPFGITGLGGVGYMRIVLRRVRRQSSYTPVLEDWIWHFFLPLLAYTAILIATLVLFATATPALFVIGASAVLLLSIGIHNAWDTVTFLAFNYSPQEQPSAASGDMDTQAGVSGDQHR
jgi:hypothetical protein